MSLNAEDAAPLDGPILLRGRVVVDADSFVSGDEAPGAWLARVLPAVAVTFARHQLVLVGEARLLSRLRTGSPGLLEAIGVPMLPAPFAMPSLAALAIARALQDARPPVALVSARPWGPLHVWSPSNTTREAPRVAHVRLATSWPGHRLEPRVELTQPAPARGETDERTRSPFGILQSPDELAGRDARDDGAVLAQVPRPKPLGELESRLLALLPGVISLCLAEKILLASAIDELGPRAAQLVSTFEGERRELAVRGERHRCRRDLRGGSVH